MSTPPPTVVLVHGAGSGPWVFDGWRQAAGDLHLVVPDLHAGLDIARAGMDDYAGRVAAATRAAEGPVALCGWSMGGLVAAAVARSDADVLVLLEPSPPAEIQGENPSVELTAGTFDPEEVYGEFPPGIEARPESSLARFERKRGISVPRLPERTLVIYGDEFAEERGRAIARHYRCEGRHVPGLDHWDLVLDQRVPPLAFDFIRAQLANKPR